MPELLHTTFYDFHLKSGARMVEYAGWSMPLLYSGPHAAGNGGGIIAEHEHTRNSASIFDVSHMGRLKITGKEAKDFLQKVCTRNFDKAISGQSMYSLVTNHAGNCLDDVIVSKFDSHWYMVCNAANREKLLGWFSQYTKDFKVDIEDETMKTAMVAIQGPKALQLLDALLPDPVSDIKRYHFEVMRYMMIISFSVFRSGYTGEDGAEIICGTTAASMAVNFLMKSKPGDDTQILKPAGLGARDTLRLEAGMPLYGHELTESIDPLSAGLGWAVDLTKEFIGADSLRKIAAAGPKQKLVGLLIDSPRSARQDMQVFKDSTPVGTITSGAMSPTLNRPIAMAYINSELATPGTPLTIGPNNLPATITPLPFYKRPKST